MSTKREEEKRQDTKNKNPKESKKTNSGNKMGKIESDGTVRDKSGNRMGEVTSSGDIRNSSGNTIGKAQGVDRRRAGAFFFFNFR